MKRAPALDLVALVGGSQGSQPNWDKLPLMARRTDTPILDL